MSERTPSGVPTRIDVCGVCKEISGHFQNYFQMYPKHIFQDWISSFPVLLAFGAVGTLGLLAFEFLGCGGPAMPEA